MILKTIGSMLVVAAFNAVAYGVLLVLPPLFGLVWVVGLGAAFSWWQLRRDAGWALRKEVLRLRRPQAGLPWVLLACSSTLLLALGLVGFIERYAPPSALDDLGAWDAILAYESTRVGAAALSLLGAGLVPLVEEFYFRGHIQHRLEGRFTPAVAVGITSVLFMALHVGVPHWSLLLVSLLLGAANGAAVYLFGSIWVGVAAHAAWNGLVGILHAVHADPTTLFGPMPAEVLVPLSVVLVGLGASGWAGTAYARRRGAMSSGGAGAARAEREALHLVG